jgi:hypothetical protein
MASARPDSYIRAFRIIFWSGFSGPERQRRRKQAFAPLICHPGPLLNGPARRGVFFASGRGSA